MNAWDRLLRLLSEDSRELGLDAVGDAIGHRAITPPQIDAILDALEHAGRRVTGAPAGSGVERLRAVLDATRALAAELGRRPTREEIAARSGLSADAIAHALALAKIMQR